MFRHRVVQDVVVANLMERFFLANKGLVQAGWGVDEVAVRYGEFLWNGESKSLVQEKVLSRSRFYVGLSTGEDFSELTKRAALISDTLLLSHDWAGDFRELGVPQRLRGGTLQRRQENPMGGLMGVVGDMLDGHDIEQRRHQTATYGMHCPDMTALGQWILDAEPLLKAGLAWYLPSYSTGKLATVDGKRLISGPSEQVKAIDYLVRDGRAVDASGAEPIKSRLIRPVLQTELPFLTGVGLRDFSKITVNEFAAYSAFRDFLRISLLELDESLNATQSERELVRLGLAINDQVRAARAEMMRVRRKRAVAASGATIGSVAAILVAVYGPALEAAIAALGVSGGVWGVINAATEYSPRALRENKWYYVWALAEKGRSL
ncbi:hypothetical protein GCM10029976_038590 [Kribbella albertanoniae]|uniref:Uncharacterized protein n=1 Tax=Kribbella albertanoniae TaxID=1266829 RepID=A0A4R4PQI1_9ACTN|nr:hypothetical protein [Kribbella albertanoniae]TDC24502.1 hypothetical protein E1261_26050 [Kribbella albertanoniae]